MIQLLTIVENLFNQLILSRLIIILSASEENVEIK